LQLRKPAYLHKIFFRYLALFTSVFLSVAYLLIVLGLIPLARFPREWIEVTVYPEALEVNGLYIYANPWPFPIAQGLKTPLPVDPQHPLPANVKITKVGPDGETPLRSHWFLQEPYFTLHLPAQAEVWVRVRYRQLALDQSGTYLLKSTRPWRRPLDYGAYVLITRDVTLLHSNYPLRDMSFTRQHFMPQQDWQLRWEKS